MIEFTVNGNTYRAEKLDAFKQLHVSRKIAPIVPTLIPIFSKLGEASSDMNSLADVLQPLAENIARMPDEMAEYVVSTCLGVVKRQQGNTWSSIWNPAGRVLMFDDIELGVMLHILVVVIKDNLGNFISGLLVNNTSQPTAN